MSKVSEDFQKSIRVFLDEVDEERTKELHRIILQDLGLENDNFTSKLSDLALERLSLLAFAGSKKTQPIFAEAIRNAVSCDAIAEKKKTSRKIEKNDIDKRKACEENRSLLFANPIGRKLLIQLLLWNNELEKKNEDDMVTQALAFLTSNILEFIGIRFYTISLHIIIYFNV